jgi:hypothetical protein
MLANSKLTATVGQEELAAIAMPQVDHYLSAPLVEQQAQMPAPVRSSLVLRQSLLSD